GRTDDADLVAPLVTGECQLVAELAHLLDADLLGLLDEPQIENIGVLSGENAAAPRADAAGRLRGLGAQNELRSPLGEPVPAGAGSFLDQQCVRHSICGVG